MQRVSYNDFQTWVGNPMTEHSLSKTPLYNLNLVLKETGIKADTLRAWERRYQLPMPERTPGGHRIFSEYDIETIKWLMNRQQEGLRISQAVELWRELLNNGVNPLQQSPTDRIASPVIASVEPDSEHLSQLRENWIQAALDFDEESAQQILIQSFAQFSMETVCTGILSPALEQIGSAWYRGEISVQQEHFTSELVIRRLEALISSAPKPIHTKKILIGCPPGEQHTVSALMITLLLKYRGWEVIYLGANVPTIRLQEAIENIQPDLAVMTATRLNTAAALLDVIDILSAYQVPGAYGGWVFSQIPTLTKHISGHYLGNTLLEAIPLIENLLTKPLPDLEPALQSSPYQELISHFTEKMSLIGDQVLQTLKESSKGDFPSEDIQQVMEYLADDLLAALRFGVLTLIESNLDWAAGLLQNRQLSRDLLDVYLDAYQTALDNHLGDSGKVIVEVLDKYIIKS
jgi:methanogenic corrinoid protein MtbC1